MMCLMTACNDKNEPDDKTPQKDLTPVAAFLDFRATFDTLTVEQCDIWFDYYDEHGQKQKEAVTSCVWNKSVKSDKLPAILGLKWTIEIKEDLDPTKYDRFLVGSQFEFKSGLVNKDGIVVKQPNGSYSAVGIDNLSVAIDKRETLINSIHEHNPLHFVHQYDADGNFTKGDWE